MNVIKIHGKVAKYNLVRIIGLDGKIIEYTKGSVIPSNSNIYSIVYQPTTRLIPDHSLIILKQLSVETFYL